MQLSVDTSSPVPPFEQIRAQIADAIAAGTLPSGHRLPSIRQLAADLGLASGTVARAYAELESSGLVRSAGARGTRVAPGAAARGLPDEIVQAADAFVAAGQANGVNLATMLSLVRARHG